jgi:RNA polymerase sigma-70 factor (ECF subfamily)
VRSLRKRSDRQLLEAAGRGEAEAFAVFYRRYGDLLMAYYLRRVGDAELAADLMMEVFAAALSAATAPAWRVPDEPGRWLFGVAHNKLVDSYRRGTADARAREALGLEPTYLDDEDIARINELSDGSRLAELLRCLPRDQREAVRARILDDESYDEIAARVGSSAMVVRKRVSRGLQQLRSAAGEGR